MPATLQQVQNALEGTELESVSVKEFQILDSDQSAIVLRINPKQIEASWHIVRQLIDETRRWPIVTSVVTNDDSLSPKLADQLFSRFFYSESPGNHDQSPQKIVERSRSVNVDDFLAQRATNLGEDECFEVVEHLLDQAVSVTGKIPDMETLDSSLIYQPHMIDRHIHDYEVENNLFAPNPTFRWSWYEPDNAYLVLLPVERPWDALAYIHWWPTTWPGAEYYIALGNRWHERYGAELACHYGTMLQCFVARPPQYPAEAWGLAREHALASTYQFSATGTEVREYASGLLSTDRWFFHDRP